MKSAKDMFFDERDNETYEDVMNWQNRKPVKKFLTPVESVQKLNKDLIDAKFAYEEIKKELQAQIVEKANTYFAFENKKNIPSGIVLDMANNPGTPYYYFSEFSGAVQSYGRYQGENNHIGKCFENPFFDWKGEDGKKARHSEKVFNRKYNS